MADCPCLPRCPFFHDKMESKAALADIYKKRYCLGDHLICARHMVFSKLGRTAVPADLYPNQADRAREILARSGSS